MGRTCRHSFSHFRREHQPHFRLNLWIYSLSPNRADVGLFVSLTSIVGRLIFARKPYSKCRVLTVIGIFAGVSAACVHLFVSSSTHLPWLIWGLAPVAGTLNYLGAVLIGRATFKSRPKNETAALQRLNRIALQRRFSELRVRSSTYDLTDTAYVDGAYVIRDADDGWHVFVARSQKVVNERIFSTEEEACRYLFSAVTSDPRCYE